MPEEKMNRKERMKELMKLYRSEDPAEHDYAAEVIVSENMAYVVQVINRNFSSYKKEYFEDLKQEGVTGLIEALINYDPEKGAFTTWADAPIRHRISDFVSRQIHNVHPHYARNISKIRSAIEQNEQKVSSDDEERKAAGSMDVMEIVMKSTGMKPEEVRRAMDIWRMSDFASIDEDGMDTLSDGTMVPPEEAYEAVEESDTLLEAINELPEKERKVISLRFGIGEYAGYQDVSQAEAAEITGVPAHLYRAVLSSAIGHLRKDKKLQAIRGERVSRLSERERNTPLSLTDLKAAERAIVDLKEEEEYEASTNSLAMENGNDEPVIIPTELVKVTAEQDDFVL